jgi:hypothetical protein
MLFRSIDIHWSGVIAWQTIAGPFLSCCEVSVCAVSHSECHLARHDMVKVQSTSCGEQAQLSFPWELGEGKMIRQRPRQLVS